jgi:cellulose synthase/poly-beta-1,6-N-acetylglucosamine synthase-like glycosyltransferase
LSLSDQAPSLVRISTFAFLVKNLIRQRGLQRIGGFAHLTGTGMAIPWGLFDASDLATSDLVEDLSLGLQLHQKGFPAQLVESARVTSPAASSEGTFAQRERWEGGYLRVSAAVAPLLLGKAAARRDWRLALCALDLFVPPVALLTTTNALVFVSLTGIFAAGGTSSSSPILAGLLLATTACVLIMAWWVEFRKSLRLGDVAAVPLYVIKKLPSYARLLVKGPPREWTRGERREM